jgi:primosomal protein N' (replication factor Y)
MGTQRVEEELARKFPHVRMVRVDSDTMQHAEQYRQIITDFEAGRLDIIVGTQMIAKGLDFPFVSLVGVVNADTALAIPDFRSAERTFQLITQVAGRAGRGDTAGTVIVQSLHCDPDAPAPIQAAIRQDYERFAHQELQLRRKVMLPPWARLTRITLADTRQSRCRDQAGLLAQRIRQVIKESGSAVRCIGPQPSPIERIRNQYRFDVLLLAPSAPVMQKLLAALREHDTLRTRTRSISVDVDPVALL